MSEYTSEYVLLHGGLAVPVTPMLLVLDLEARGLHVSHEGADIIVEPFSALSDADKAGLRRWRHHVLALLDYEPPRCA